MRPYYQSDGATLWLGDCREVLPTLPVADVCITDPPFAEQTHAGARTTKGAPMGQAFVDFDCITSESLHALIGVVAPLVRRWFVATMDYAHVPALYQSPPPGLKFIRFGVWTKAGYTPQMSGDRPAQGWEAVAILHADNGRTRWNGHGIAATWHMMAEREGEYPTQKPLPLVQEFVRLFSDPGETILDPFCGSGTTGVAALRMGRSFVGIDKREAALEIAAKRLSTESRQTVIAATRPKQIKMAGVE